jgi:hypothetical protein
MDDLIKRIFALAPGAGTPGSEDGAQGYGAGASGSDSGAQGYGDLALAPGFEELALEVFALQFERNAVYREFCQALGRTPGNVAGLAQVPFLPVELFRQHRVVSFEGQAEAVFVSSGTTAPLSPAEDPQANRSRHFVKDLSIYEQSFSQSFRQFYGDPSGYCILALLPSYLEREGSSLVYMAASLIRQSGHPDSGFYLDEHEKLAGVMKRLADRGERMLLLGVSFALLDLAEAHPIKMKNTLVMETGGMKGRRKEMVRQELHERLMEAFSLDAIHSEYGMTELLSQAWSRGGGRFGCPPWMRVLIRDSNDPLSITDGRRTGGINVVDLANLYSCSFLATQDLGRMSGGQFEVLGRFDHSDLRGCNLMLG